MRPVKVAIAEALRTDAAVSELVPRTSVYAVERATLPTLPAVEVIGLSSERVGDGPMARHELSIECTVRHPSEDGADSLLSGVVMAVRERLGAAELSNAPIAQEGGEGVLVVLGGTRWSISAADASGVVRGASIALTAEVRE